MRAWEDETCRGKSGSYIQPGQQALVVAAWSVGNQLRIKAYRDERVLVFSCPDHCAHKNWDVAS